MDKKIKEKGILNQIKENYYYNIKVSKEDLLKWAEELDKEKPYYSSFQKLMKELLEL